MEVPATTFDDALVVMAAYVVTACLVDDASVCRPSLHVSYVCHQFSSYPFLRMTAVNYSMHCQHHKHVPASFC